MVRVHQFKIGDEVYARPADHHIGTFAEFIAIKDGYSGAIDHHVLE
jgi:alcohol dehydrogenase